MSLTRLMGFLTMLAALLSPLAMVGGTPAKAGTHHAAMTTLDAQTNAAQAIAAPGHCPKMDQQSNDRGGSAIDCLIACAATIPEPAGRLERPALAPLPAALPLLARLGDGLGPEAATPPPRSA